MGTASGGLQAARRLATSPQSCIQDPGAEGVNEIMYFVCVYRGSKGTTSEGSPSITFFQETRPSGSDVAAMAGRECRVLQQIPAPLPPSITSTKPGSACQPPCLHFGQALSTPLEHTAPTWHARSRRRPRFLMFAGVSLQINDSPPSGMEAQAFQRIWKRKPPEPTLCARAEHVIQL